MDHLVGEALHRTLLGVELGDVLAFLQPRRPAPGRHHPGQVQVVVRTEAFELALELLCEGLDEAAADVEGQV